MQQRLIVGLVLAVAALLGGCASGPRGGELSVKDELKLGSAAARRGYWQEALYRFERADRQRPQDPKILNDLAVALEAVGRYDDARAVYERASALAPADRNLNRNRRLFEEFYSTYVTPPEKGKGREAGDAGPEK